MLAGLISNIQNYSLHDGPGIRSTVFLKGCPLSCAWCHNPENMDPQPQLLISQARCIQCRTCQEVCPICQELRKTGPSAGMNAAALPVDSTTINGSCLVCGACVEACPTGARSMVGRQMGVTELLNELLADQIFYDDSGGGITFSGGEPLRQIEFLKAALLACREHGLHTAVDTCGFVPEGELKVVAGLADLFLYDLKCMDRARHMDLCGVPNDLILSNLRHLAQIHRNIWIRIPIVPGLNDQLDELNTMAAFVADLPGVRQVNLLPFHRCGLHKFQQLGHRCRVAQVTPPSEEQMQDAAAHFRAVGTVTRIGG